MGFVVPRYSILFFLPIYFLSALLQVRSGDVEALLALKSSIDPLNTLQWQVKNGLCNWHGVKDCINGRITKLVLESLNLTGTLDGKILNQLDELRVLSFKGNSIYGQIPNLSGLVNLKSLYLNNNNFSSEFPDSISTLHRLKIVVLAANKISGPIPKSLLHLGRLYVLQLQDNEFSGTIPPFNQTSLRLFNVSNNDLSGEIPSTHVLLRFNASSFVGNSDLCGEQIDSPCNGRPNGYPMNQSSKKSPLNQKQLILVIAGIVGGFICLLLLCIVCKRKLFTAKVRSGGVGKVDVVADAEVRPVGGSESRKHGVGFSWESEGVGSLVFLGAGDQPMNYSMDDLLKASAETLGRGTMASTYKAVMESGYIVTVKRLKDSRYPSLDEFSRRMDAMGRLRHPNVVPLRAYFQAKEERLLVYDYFHNGSLFTLIHGSKSSAGGKPLHWTSCLKIAEDLLTGLLYIHQNHGLAHGNLKSSNVLLGPDFESCLTDYGLNSFRDPERQEDPSAASLFYRAPECRDVHSPVVTQQSDIYSFGVLLLELLTGKTPFHDLVQEHGSDIPKWVRSVREEETESEDDPASGNETSEEKLQSLMNIAMACVCICPENRPTAGEVLKMVKDARAEAHVSSNSSGHSPGRWSDTVQSLPSREDYYSI